MIRMYQNMNKWEEALLVAETRRHPELPQLRASYHQWLMATRQEEKGRRTEGAGGRLHTGRPALPAQRTARQGRQVRLPNADTPRRADTENTTYEQQ